jgi:membrane-associated phospholipid phosphatase
MSAVPDATGPMAEPRSYLESLRPAQRWVYLALDQYSDVATNVLAGMALVLQLALGTPPGVLLSGLALVCPAALATLLVNQLCRRLIEKPRPSRLYERLSPSPIRSSFPSFHSQFAATFAAAFTTAMVLLLPPGTRGLAAGVAAASMGASVLLVAWSRLYLGVHDLVDVLAGVVLGVTVGAGVVIVAVHASLVPTGATAWAAVLLLVALELVGLIYVRRRRAA